MEEDAQSFRIALIIIIMIFIVIPLGMGYRRGYFFNVGEHLGWIKRIFKSHARCRPADWTIVGVRQLSAFEKQQVRKMMVKLMPYDQPGYRVVVILKSNNALEYPLGENKGHWPEEEIDKNNILIRTWQKGTQYKYDLMPINDQNLSSL